MLTKATVVGTGAMGTILAHVLGASGVNVALLARNEDRVSALRTDEENRRYLPGLKLGPRVMPTADAQAALRHSEFVISAIPCQYVRTRWTELRPVVPAGVSICSATKGIERGTYARPTEILRALLPDHPLAVLSGPSVAPEMARFLPTTVVVAAEVTGVAETIQEVLSTSWLRIYTNSDVVGVELAGAVKNVIALAAGMLDGMRAGDNAKAALLTRGLVEITRLGAAFGARPETFNGLAGVGDLVTTCFSPFGRNRRAGERIGAGVPVGQVLRETDGVIEGIPTTQAVLDLAGARGVEMPITRAVFEVLDERKPPLAALSDLMMRPLRAEHVQ